MWGTGTPRREFLYVDDMANATVYLTENYEAGDVINVGTGTDLSILELAELVKATIGFDGVIINDVSKPDGTPRKLLDVSLLHATGWSAGVGLREGISKKYDWFLDKPKQISSRMIDN